MANCFNRFYQTRRNFCCCTLPNIFHVYGSLGRQLWNGMPRRKQHRVCRLHPARVIRFRWNVYSFAIHSLADTYFGRSASCRGQTSWYMALRRLCRAVAYALVSWQVVVGYCTLFGHYCWGLLGQTRDRMGNQICLKSAAPIVSQWEHLAFLATS